MGNVPGTVRALYGHCTGTVRALSQLYHAPSPSVQRAQSVRLPLFCLTQPLPVRAAMLSQVRRRLTCKGPDPQFGSQGPQTTPPTLENEDVAAKRQVYLVTFPHPRPGSPLVAPGTMSRAAIVEKIVQACAAPSGTNPHRHPQPVVLDYAAVFHEMHKGTCGGAKHSHYHVALKAAVSFRFAPVKRALQDKYQLASHWSCTHVGYWSPLKYCAVPSPTKPRSALDPAPLLWSRQGVHPPLHLACHEPQTASAIRAKRQRREDHAAENSKPEPRMTDYELWPIVVESGIKNTAEDKQAHIRFMQYAKDRCSPATCAFVFKHRARLPALIDDIWRWETIDQVVAAADQTLIQCLLAAESKPCLCGGAWTRFATYALSYNGVDIAALCKAVLHSLREGRSPAAPVVTLAGGAGGEGKSFFLKGLVAVVGGENVFWTPTHPTFPLHGLEDAKIVLLDEFRFMESVVPIATQCLWFDGSAVPVAKPQTGQGSASHVKYHGRAPVFITTGMEDMKALSEAGDGDASMVLRRLNVFLFPHRVAKPGVSIPCCAPCFARFVMQHGR